MSNFVEGEDRERDQVGVVPDHPYICAACGREMKAAVKNLYKCPECGETFQEESQS